MICIMETFSDILDHLLVLLSDSQIDSKSLLDLLYLPHLILPLDVLIELGRLLDRIKEHVLLSFVDLLHVFP